jgi:hypothetical protein
MQRFRFPLESAMQYRRVQADLEKAKLQQLFKELAEWDRKAADLEAEYAEAEALTRSPAVTTVELQAMDSYREFAIYQRRRLAASKNECQSRIDAQTQRLTAAQRDYELLARLKSQKQTEWQKLADLEQESFAAEAFLAKWVRERT